MATDTKPTRKIRFALFDEENVSTKPTFDVNYVDESEQVKDEYSWMREPWTPMIGAGIAFASVVLFKRRRLNMPQAMMHARIIAQGTTVAALFGLACMHGFSEGDDTKKGLSNAL